MPAVAVLFSAGKDSALAARLLEPFYEVALCHCTFGVATDPSTAEATRASTTETSEGVRASTAEAASDGADALGLPLATVGLEESVARDAVERMAADGYPSEGIQAVHEHALERVAARGTLDGPGGRQFPVDAVADGTRRDDRTPAVGRPFAQSLEDRHGVDYVRPLAGYGRGAVDELVERYLTVETGPSERLATADYETELRALMASEYGPGTVADVFPDHTQSRVRGRRE